MSSMVLVRRLALGFVVAVSIPDPARAQIQTTSTRQSPWVAHDVGGSTPGAESHFDNGRLTISSGGGQMQGPADQFRFVYQILSGDVKITARLDSLAPALLWSNAGLMIRSSLEPAAAHGAVVVRGDAGPALQTRTQNGGLTTTRSSDLSGAGAPQWLGLERAGSRVTAYMSPDGKTWTAIGSESIELGADVYVGIAVTSSDPAQGAVAQLSRVSVGGLPAGMRHRSVGGPGTSGTAWHSEGVYTLTAGGGAARDAHDRFHFAYRRMQGDLDVVARVTSLSPAANAGVMIRESLSADSRHAAILVSGKNIAFDRRTETGASSERTDGGPGGIPAWVKLVRRGPEVEVFRSSDGSAWTSIGTTSIATGGDVYVGLAVSSETAGTSSPARTAEATAVLDDVSITSAADSSGSLTSLLNLPPIVALTSPTTGGTFSAPATITLTALASDPELRMAGVEFYANGTLLGTDTSSPYSFTWTSVPAGSYTLTAVAFDADGGRTTSLAASITVQPGANGPPSVSLTSPANGATFNAPATIELTASASDPENRLARVEFYRDGMLLGSDSSSPYSFTWSSAPAGTYSLTAVAFDSDGAQATSAAVSITVRGPNQPPTVSITSPANGATFTAPATIPMTASASDPENRLGRVEFYRNGTLLGSDSSSPYSFTWSSAPAGSYTLTAVAVDLDGAQATSSAVPVTVNTNQPPSVTLTAPANGATFTAPATIPMTASASDPENRLARVEFYANGTLLGADSSSPYAFTWSSVPGGSYTLTAKVFDSDGAQMTSSAVTITVIMPPDSPPRLVAMTASTEHDTGVDSYLLEVFAGGADPETASPIASSDLGKPTPDANREISVDRSSFFSALPPGNYTATVKAIGPGGSARSTAVNFTR
jgi:hypothetical protein